MGKNDIKVGDVFFGEDGRVVVDSLRKIKLFSNDGMDTLVVDFLYIDLDVLTNGGCSISRFTERFKKRCRNNRLAKKLYPNAEESEDGRWLYV